MPHRLLPQAPVIHRFVKLAQIPAQCGHVLVSGSYDLITDALPPHRVGGAAPLPGCEELPIVLRCPSGSFGLARLRPQAVHSSEQPNGPGAAGGLVQEEDANEPLLGRQMSSVLKELVQHGQRFECIIS